MSQSWRGQVSDPSRSWPGLLLELCGLLALVLVAAMCLGRFWNEPPYVEPVLAIPPALAGIRAVTAWRPLVYGAASLLAVLAIALWGGGTKPASLSAATAASVLAVTAVSGTSAVRSARRNRRLADVTSVAEVAQRTVLRPLPPRMGTLELDVVYLAAAAEARVGGDLYEVARTPYGIRLVMGDVRGKGLGAVEIAADVLGAFREAAYDAPSLAEVALRLDVGLARRWEIQEEFVTAVIAEIDPEAGVLTIYNCGHPSPLLLSPPVLDDRTAGVMPLDVPAAAPPLGLLSLGDASQATRTVPFRPGDELLLYTDGVTEARDRAGGFYPLAERVAALRSPATRDAADSTAEADLLERLRADLLRHVGAPLGDDAALLHVRIPRVPVELPTDADGNPDSADDRDPAMHIPTPAGG